MKLIPLSCRRCGGPLQVPDDVPTVTCLHCGTRLKVVGHGSAAHTETLESLDRRTEQIEDRVDDLHLRSAIAELDRNWEVERERYCIVGHFRGVPIRRRPDWPRERVTAAFVVVGGILLAALLAYATHTEWGRLDLVGVVTLLLPLPGVLIAAAGVRGGILAHRRANAYDAGEREYLRRRAELERTLESRAGGR